MTKPSKVEVGQRWRVTRGDITLNGVIVETDATHATIEWIMAGGSAPWKTRWLFQSVHDDSAMTFLGYGPQQGAGPEAGKACDCMYGPCDCGAAPKPAPEVVPSVAIDEMANFGEEQMRVLDKLMGHVIPYPKLEPGFYGKGIGELLEAQSAHEFSTEGVARVGNLTALQGIQARKKPDPWIPSIDDWDLLPDQ